MNYEDVNNSLLDLFHVWSLQDPDVDMNDSGRYEQHDPLGRLRLDVSWHRPCSVYRENKLVA